MALCQQASLDAGLAPISRIGPGFFPTQRCFRHGSIHREPVPLDPVQFIKLHDSCLPELEKNTCFHPHLKAIVGRRMRTQFSLVEGLLLAPSSQHIENRVCTAAIGHAGSPPTKAMRIDMHRQ